MWRQVIWPAVAIGLLCAVAVAAEQDATSPQPSLDTNNQPAGEGSSPDVAMAVQDDRWIATVDSPWFSHQENKVGLGQTANASGTVLNTLRSNDVDGGTQPGLRIFLTHCYGDFAWEFGYFGLQNWSGARTLTASSSTLATSEWLQTDNLITAFDTSLGYHSTNQLHSAELNYRCALPNVIDNKAWSVEGLMGLRYLEWDETFNLNGVDTAHAAVENIDTVAHNFMIGPQIGIEFQGPGEQVQLGFHAKASLLANFLQQSRSNLNSTGATTFGSFAAFVPFDELNRETTVAGLIDVAAFATYHVNSRLAVKGGYQLLYASGLALAAMQMGGFQHKGEVLLHGPTAGLEFGW